MILKTFLSTILFAVNYWHLQVGTYRTILCLLVGLLLLLQLLLLHLVS